MAERKPTAPCTSVVRVFINDKEYLVVDEVRFPTKAEPKHLSGDELQAAILEADRVMRPKPHHIMQQEAERRKLRGTRKR